jgi:outer membrane protein OmpA-like peptidoglycan-associated protein
MLLTELSAAKMAPSRDERGVIVTLRDAFRGDGIASSTEASLQKLGQVARQHPETPLLVVAHSARGGASSAHDTARAAAAADILRGAGAPRVASIGAGGVQPVVPTATRGASGRNERLEVVFVTRAW